MDELIDKRLVELENWGDLIRSPEFKVLTAHINERVARLSREIEKLAGTPKLDSSIEMMGKVMARKELSSLLSLFESKLVELQQAKLKQALRPQA